MGHACPFAHLGGRHCGRIFEEVIRRPPSSKLFVVLKPESRQEMAAVKAYGLVGGVDRPGTGELMEREGFALCLLTREDGYTD
jgi:hypothetical protein